MALLVPSRVFAGERVPCELRLSRDQLDTHAWSVKQFEPCMFRFDLVASACAPLSAPPGAAEPAAAGATLQRRSSTAPEEASILSVASSGAPPTLRVSSDGDLVIEFEMLMGSLLILALKNPLFSNSDVSISIDQPPIPDITMRLQN